MTQKISGWLAVAAGVIFLISGFAKAVDTKYFENVIVSLGVDYIELAPVIILTEIALGLALIFDVCRKLTALLAAGITIVFSIVYTYGLLVLDIKDCGCFGTISVLNTSPLLLYLRNGLLIIVLVFVAINERNFSFKKQLDLPVWVVSIITIGIAAFLTGNSFSWNIGGDNKNAFEPMAVADSRLNSLIKVSPDSTYLLTFFSFSCPHCMNTIGNMMQYAERGVVDHVKTFVVEDAERENEFMEFFKPTFEIKKISASEMLNVSNELPISFFIQRDTIVGIVPGEIPSAFLLKDRLFVTKGSAKKGGGAAVKETVDVVEGAQQ